MSVSTIGSPDNGVMSSSEQPSGGDGPRRRRSFTAEDKVWFPRNRGGLLYAASGSVSAAFS